MAESAMAKVLAMLEESGYGVSFNLYNTADFGVPQQRQRVIIIASRDGRRVPDLAPTHCDRPDGGLLGWKTLRDAIGDMVGIKHHHFDFPPRRLEFLKKLKEGQNWRDLSEEDQMAAMSEATRSADGGKSGFFRRLAWNEPCPTLVCSPIMPATDLCHPDEDRPLSIEEYRRIQQFPDHWELCGSLDSQYRQVGNAVPVTFGRAIGLTILAHMRTEGSDAGVPDVVYSRYPGNSDRDWCSVDAAKARLTELAKEIRLADEDAKELFRIAMRNTLPHAKTVGDFLVEARSLCNLAMVPWEPWPSDNCDLSLRTAQAYIRIAENWEKVLEGRPLRL